MKKRNLFFTVFTFLSIHNGFALSLLEAKNEGLISLEINMNLNGTHYHSPFQLKVENLTSRTLDLELANGLVLVCEDEDYQNFILTNEVLLSLKSKETQNTPIFAMCIEEKDMGPIEGLNYQIQDIASKDLKRLSAFIQANKTFEPDPQFLMWEIASNEYDNIDTFKVDEDGNVWAVRVIDNKEVTVGFGEDVHEDVPERKLIVNGQFEMNFSRQKSVHIAMFNIHNVIVKELYRNLNTPIGSTKLNYEFNSLEYQDENYLVKLVVDGEVLLIREIEMKF